MDRFHRAAITASRATALFTARDLLRVLHEHRPNEWNYGNTWNYFANSKVTRGPFGQNSACKWPDVTDGTSNVTAFVETTLLTGNGGSNAWGYRGWVMVGVSLYGNSPHGINQWQAPASWSSWYQSPPMVGKVIQWANAGSLHPAGCQG